MIVEIALAECSMRYSGSGSTQRAVPWLLALSALFVPSIQDA